MYEITIRVDSPTEASRIVSLIVRSDSYEDVEGVRVARVGGEPAPATDVHARGGDAWLARRPGA